MVDYAARRTMMVDTQIRPNEVTRYHVLEAFLNVPREAFLPPQASELAYLGENVPVAPGRILFEPRTIGKMLEALNVQPGELVMDLACGYGYASALLSRMAGAVVAVEDDAELVREAEARLAATDAHNVAVINAGLTTGAPAQGPFDAIFVGGAVEEIPDELIAQLRDGGRIVALFMEGQLGTVRLGHKIDGRVNWRYAFNASAPLLPGFVRQTGFVF
ncbi:MAG: protein-L-isoaspartate O-methyltransferase [Paracoccus sp. (in: a-proteobacteria)]|nr:protein-L-isoaspartate O-methyltransferase [Paracoccus sp. (in: a-proteobacteria)]